MASKWKFQQIEPQPARGKFHEGLWTDPNWIAEEKYDGDRRIAQFCERVVRFTGRKISVKDGLFVEKTENVPHLSGSWITSLRRGELQSMHLKVPPSLDGTVLDGEMIFHPETCDLKEVAGGFSKFVTSIMGSLPEEAVRKQIERGWLRYVVFDCLFHKGVDVRRLSWAARHGFMRKAVEEWANPFVHVAIFEGHAHSRSLYDTVVARGGEGVILKHIEGKYGDKNGWVKVKKTATADVVIMGFVPAKEMSKKKGEDKATLTKYAKAGLIGAVQVGQYGHPPPTWKGGETGLKVGPAQRQLLEVATISGIDDALREAMTMGPGRFIGKVVEIKHNGREPTGRFRHPRFKCFREDKRAIDCVIYDGEV